jgi:hypothetical protein
MIPPTHSSGAGFRYLVCSNSNTYLMKPGRFRIIKGRHSATIWNIKLKKKEKKKKEKGKKHQKNITWSGMNSRNLTFLGNLKLGTKQIRCGIGKLKRQRT